MVERSETWALLLDPGETLVWQGRPATDLRFRKQDWVLFVIAGGLAGLSALVFLSDVRTEAPTWFLVMFGAMGVLGAGLIPLVMLKERARRKRTHYALTDQRALILEGRRLRAYPLSETNRLDIVSYGDRTSVYFKDEYLMAGGMNVSKGAPVEIGFEWITDGGAVHEHLVHMGVPQSGRDTGVTMGAQV